MLQDILSGVLHVDVSAAPGTRRGALVGSEGGTVVGSGGAELAVPMGALTDTIAVDVTALDPESLGIGFGGLTVLGALEVDLAGQTLATAGTASLEIGSLASAADLFAAKLVYVSGQRRLALVGVALFDAGSGRISTGGVDTGGTFLFFQSDEPLALVSGTVTEGGSPAAQAVVESSTTPFVDVTDAAGAYLVAAKLSATTVTARSLANGNVGSAATTPATTDPVTLDVALTSTGPFVTQMRPADGELGVALAPAIRATFSEPVSPATVTTSSFVLRLAGGASVSGRVILGASSLSASFLPDANLDPLTSYELELTSAITDVTGNPLLPVTTGFTTLDDAAATFDPHAVQVSFPDANGEVTVTAPPGTFEPDAFVTLVNLTRGIVVTGDVQNDGSFTFLLRAAITDELQIRVLSSDEREIVIDKTEYHAADGSVAIGRKGGRIAVGEFTLDVPEGAMRTASIFELEPVDQAVIDAMPLPGAAGGKGSAVEIAITGAPLELEADLSFAIPAAAPTDADFAIVRALDVGGGVTVYETIDSGTAVNGEVTTDSFPFVGVTTGGPFYLMWYPPLPVVMKSPLGAITGIAQETNGDPVAPKSTPLAGVRVSVDKPSGSTDGDYVAATDENGRFTLFDQGFGSTGGQVNLLAVDGAGREVRAVAIEHPGVVQEFTNLSRYNRSGTVVFNFPITTEPPAPAVVTLRFYQDDGSGGEQEIVNGFVEVGKTVTVRLEFSEPPGPASLTVGGAPQDLRQIEPTRFEATWFPSVARSYVVEVEAVDENANPIHVSKTLLAVNPGAGNDQSLPGPPAVISDASIPRPGSTGVVPTSTFSVSFTEPVTNVSTLSVKLLQTSTSDELPLELVGIGPGGVGLVNPSDVITALTIRPLEGLEFATKYTLRFSGAIVDTDATPIALELEPDPTDIEFTTFEPTIIAAKGEESEQFSLASLGNLLFKASRLPLDSRFGTLRVDDFANPVEPKPIPERDSEIVGTLIQRARSEASVELGQGGGSRDLVGVLAFETFSGNTGLTLFDVTNARKVTAGLPTPFPYVGFVTTSVPGDGFGADLATRDRYAFVASGGAGLKVVDLGRAYELLLEQGPKPVSPSPSSTPEPVIAIPSSVRTALFTRGQGFGQEAIVAASGFPGADAISVAVGELSSGLRGFVGLRRHDQSGYDLASIDLTIPSAPGVLALRELSLGATSLGWPNRIAVATVEGRDLAVVVGGAASQGQGRMAVVEVTDPSNPVVKAVVDLQGSWGRSVDVAPDGTVVVATPEGIELYSVVQPEATKFVGRLTELVSGRGEATLVNGLVVASLADDGDPTTTGSALGIAALDLRPILQLSNFIVIDDQFQSVDGEADFLGAVVPPDYELRSSEIVLYGEGVEVSSLAPDPFLAATVAKGLPIPEPPAPQSVQKNGAELVLNRGLDDEKRSLLDLYGNGLIRPLLGITVREQFPTDPPRYDMNGIPVARLKLDVDATNGTVCLVGNDRVFVNVARKAIVTGAVVIDGVETPILELSLDPATSPNGDGSFELPFIGTTELVALLPPVSASYTFRVRAKLQSDPTVEVVRDGRLDVSALTHNVLPVGHTFVKGVDLYDGHLVASSTDVRIAGRGPGLEVVRTYGSLGGSSDGALGAGWNLNYHSRLMVTDCFWTIVGGDGSGQRFTQLGNDFVPQRGYHTTLRRNDDGSYDCFTKGRIRYHYVGVPRFAGDSPFADRPNLDFIEDTNGNRLDMFYDVAGNLIEVRELFADGTTGRSLTFEYTDVLGVPRISRVTGPLGLEILYEYDEWANLIEVTRDVRTESYEYSVGNVKDRHNLTATIDPNGRRTEYAYFAEGTLFPGEQGDEWAQGKYEFVQYVHEGVGTAAAATTEFLYDATDFSVTTKLRTVVTDARNNETEYILNKDGSPESITEPGKVVTTMVWSTTDIMKLEETDANNRVTLFEYDENANLTKETIQAGAPVGDVITEFAYDPTYNKMTLKRVHNVDAQGSPVVQETHFEIDPANGNLLSTTDAEGNVTQFLYGANGDLEQVIGPRPGQETFFTYDAHGNPETTTDALGNVTTTVYDARSRLLSTTDTFGRSSSQQYDALDRVTEVTRTDSSGSSDEETVVRTYYPGGQVLTETNGLGLVTTFTLDGLNRVSGSSDTLGYTTSTVYDGNGNVTETTDRRGVVTANTYDALNRLTQVQVSGPYGPTQVVATMGYDAVGNKLFETDLSGNRTELVYDALYRVTERKLPTDLVNHVEDFSYDRVGNKLTESDAKGNPTSYEYDLLNRVTQRTDALGNVVTFEYDEAGNVELEHDVTRGLRKETDYDALNRPIEQRVLDAPSTFTYVTTFQYDDAGHAVTVEDPRGFETTTYLDGFDRTHRVEQDTGDAILVTTSFYDANGNVRRTEDAEGRATDFTYDGLNRLLQIDHPLTYTTEYDYDGGGNTISETNRRDLTTTFTYDNLGRPLTTSFDASITGVTTATSVAYNDSLRQRVETDARGKATTYEMDEQGRVVKITDPATEEQTFEYDGVNKTAEADKLGNRTELEYDALNRLTIVRDALLQELTTVYDDAARTVTETDRKDYVKTTQLDALGRLVSVTRSGVLLEEHEYDGNGNRTLSTDANGNQTEFEYDGANRLIARTDGFGSSKATRTTFKYDGVGNLLEEKDGRVTGKPFDVKSVYDDLNRLTSVEDAEGNVTTFEYDGEGNKTAQVEPKGAAYRTEHDYGELNELIEVRMADGGVYEYGYDANRNRTSQTDAEDNVVTFSYDDLNRVDLMTQDPGGFGYVTDHDYDANGNEVKLTDPKGQVVDFEYDELNRLEKKVYNLTSADYDLYTRTHEITFHYDANDNLEQIDELKSTGTDPPALVYSYKAYDALDRLTSETDAWGRTLTYDYDDQGNRTLLVDPDNKRSVYAFDALNRLETLTLDEGTANEEDVNYEYFPNGLKKKVTNPNGTVSTYLYDASGRMTYIGHTGPTGVISSYDYTYDENGNREQQIETNAGRTETTGATRTTWSIGSRR